MFLIKTGSVCIQVSLCSLSKLVCVCVQSMPLSKAHEARHIMFMVCVVCECASVGVCVGVRASASWLNVGATSSGHLRAWAWVRAWACVGRRGSRLPSVFCSPKHLCVGVSVCVSPVCGPVCVEARGVDTGPSLTVMKATVTV